MTVAFQINTDVGIVDDRTDLVPALEAALADLAIAHIGGETVSEPLCNTHGSTARWPTDRPPPVRGRTVAEARPVGEVTSLEGYSGAVLGQRGPLCRVAAGDDGLLVCPTRRTCPPCRSPSSRCTCWRSATILTAATERATYTATARELVTPIDEVFFEGMIDPARLSFFDRMAVRLVKSPVGDRRDWDRIAGMGRARSRPGWREETRMTARRSVLLGLAGLVLAGGGYAAGAYRVTLAGARRASPRRSSVIATERRRAGIRRRGERAAADDDPRHRRRLRPGAALRPPPGRDAASGSSRPRASAIFAAPFPTMPRRPTRPMCWWSCSTPSGSTAFRWSAGRPVRSQRPSSPCAIPTAARISSCWCRRPT